MIMELLNKIINEYAITALSLTVIKSVWIGAVISGLTAILFTFIRKSARMRYIIATTGLVIIFISSIIVYININNSQQQSNRDEAMIPAVTSLQPSDGDLKNDAKSILFNIPGIIRELLSDAERLFIYNSGIIVLIWIIGVIIFSLKFTGGHIYARRLSNRITTEIPDIWAARIEKIAKKINLKTKIRTVKSAFARIPMVMGWIKPVIILPASILSGIPAEQVEAILAHELAHIKRKDYLVNIFQSFIEIIMFFNPSVWWISGIIRRERENCCDDVALAAGTESIVYAKALVSIQEISFSPPVTALAIKSNNNLINRIKRITAMKNRNNILKEKFVAIFSIVLLVSSLVALTGFDKETSRNPQIALEKSSAISNLNYGKSPVESTYPVIHPQDTVRQKEIFTIKTRWIDPADNKEKEVKMSIKNSQVTELILDGEVIPPEDYHFYQDLIDDTVNEYEQAMKELEDLDVDKIKEELEEARLEMENIDMEAIEKELQEARLEIENIDMEAIEKELQKGMRELENLDMEAIEKELQKGMRELENLDMEAIKKELQKGMKELENLDMEAIEKELQEALKELETIDMKEIEKSIEKARKNKKN